jgi:drug/metabolite transporter (DMT)-like permease
MNPVAAFFYACIVGCGLYINKYVLSILGFRYPTIFQGWQTLTGLIIYKLLTCASKASFKLATIDRPAFISLLPGFLFFTTSLIASSKALAVVPIPIYVSVFNTLPAIIYLLDTVLPNRPPVGPLQLGSAVATLLTGGGLVLSQVGLNFSDSAYFWLVVGVVCSAAYTLHTRIADARYASWDRLYYNSIFSVIVLAPASFYLEEAFEALNFHHDRQELFLAGCLASAMLGAAANLYSVRLKQDEYFGPVQHLACGVAAIVSPLLFTTNLSTWEWCLVVLNVVAAVPIPSHVSKDEDESNFPGIIQDF